MRKHLTRSAHGADRAPEDNWLDLDRLASVEVTSEDASHPIEAALLSDGDGPRGWRAAEPGAQLVRIIFDEPQRIRRIRMHIVEPAGERTQEFVLRWSADAGATFRDVVRQQWHFSEPNATTEIEDYQVDLDGVRILELAITPDIGGRRATASLLYLRLGSRTAVGQVGDSGAVPPV